MVKGTVSAGPGFVGGSVLAGANKSTAPGDGIANMTVYLLNAAGTSLIQTATTDAQGAFSFSNVANGSYKVYPEDGGSATTAIPVTVSSSQANLTHIDFEKSFSLKTIKPKASGITAVADKAIFSLYPNPATDKLTVKMNAAVNATVHVSMTNVEGRVVLSKEVKLANQSADINVSGLGKGVYFISVKDGDKTSAQQIVLQ